MEASKCQDRAAARFEKVIRFYWDGVPIPPFVITERDGLQRTFTLKQLNYSPDYYGDVRELPLIQEEPEFKGFYPLSRWEKPHSTISCRIGSHHSPNVGLFMFSASTDDLKVRTFSKGKVAKEGEEEVKIIRIPADPCDLPQDWDDSVRWKYREFIRTSKLLELYVPIVKEFCPITLSSLRQIVSLATSGISPHRKESVVRETLIVKDEYTRWMCQYVFYYMCADPLFGKILAPLQLITRAEPVPYTIIALNKEDRAMTQANFSKSRKSLMESIVWKCDTRKYFMSLRTLWNSRLKRIVFFDLTTKEWMTDAETFGKQMRTSLRSAFSRIRIEFYSYVEDFFFTYIENAKDILRMTEDDLQNSDFQRIFNATRVFLVNEVRAGLFEGLEKVVEFFTCFGNFHHTCKTSRRIAKKYPVIGFNLVVGESSIPRAPDFTNLVTLIRSLFDEFIAKLKELPRIEYVLMPTLTFRKEPIQFLSESEIVCYRSSLMEILDEASLKIDIVSSLYANFSALPSKDASIAKRGDTKEIMEHISLLRGKFHDVSCATTDTVFCGRFAIKCTGIKRRYAEKWENFLLKFYDELHKAAMSIIEKCEERCVRSQTALRQTPATVADLEQYLIECATAKTLSETLKDRECQDILRRISCMEESQVPIENYLYHAAEKLMRWPQMLQQDLAAAEVIKQKCRPVLRDQVEKLRRETRYHIKSLSTGLLELYHMFPNLEMSDVAEETCMELRDCIVDDALEKIDKILHQEKALEIETEDTFEDFYPLINHFETIEQFWMTISKTTDSLKEFYASPVPALNIKMVESVREWRRLIHCATRNLRGFPPLVRIGQQQEVALAKFEALEELIILVTTPGLRKNHWKEIARLLASKLQEDVVLVTEMNISFQRLLDADIILHMDALKRIVSQASSDFHVESMLEEMKSSAKKIHFQVESVSTCEISTRFQVPDECHTSILAQIEDYVGTCRRLKCQSGLSGAITRALNEWEAATEKTRDMLLEWRKIEAQWIPLHNYLLTVQKAQKKERKVQLVPIFERLLRAHEAFHQLHLKINKPQFSLYMAVVQETVMEHLTAAKTALGELRPLLGEVFEKKRVAFPRFNFLTDEQLLTYLSAYNVNELKPLLPYLYPRLTDFEVKNNCVVAFTSVDGYTIKANPVVPIQDSLTHEWMCNFDTTLARSVFSATKECCLEYGKGPLKNWLEAHCPQMLTMGLRVVHTNRMRQALSFSGEKGLQAYQIQLKNMREEFCRLIKGTHDSKKRNVISQMLSYFFNAELDVFTALDKNIKNLMELDGTTMVQTFISDNDSKTRILGVDFTNGNEFYGSLDIQVVMSPEIVERILILLVLTLMGKITPTVCGPKRRILPYIVVGLLGRFFIPIQCHYLMTIQPILAYLRGAIQIGAVLCFHDTESLGHEIRSQLNDIISQVSMALTRGKREELSLMLPVGPDGTTVPTPVNRHFHAVLTCGKFEELPRNIAFECRPIQMPSIDCATIIRGALYSYGYADEASASLQFGSVYELFQRTKPLQFTMRILLHVVQSAAEAVDNRPMVEKLCISFFRMYFSTLKDDSVLQKLFINAISTILCLDYENNLTCIEIHEKLNAMERPNTHQVFSRFADLITTSRRVIISGAPFSGKTKVWKRWVGNAPHFVFSPSITSAADMFGREDRRGLLATLAGKKDLATHTYIIMEGGAYLRQTFWGRVEDYARILGGERGYIVGNSSFIITTRRLHQMDPGVCSLFSQFNMDITYTWPRFLKKCLVGAPHGELPMEVLEIVLGNIFQCIKEECKGLIVKMYSEDYHLLAASQRCANLYKSWFEYAKNQFKYTGSDEEWTIDERAFAAQCAIMAACWGTGFALSNEDKPVIDHALVRSEQRLGDLMESYDVIFPVVPSFKDQTANNIFHLIATPCGWKTHQEASNYGFTYNWSNYSNMNPQQPSSFQIFEVPSRLNVLRAAECLMDCGENVFICGDSGSGRSTLLRTTRFSDRWVPCNISCSKGINPTSIAETIHSRLTRRSDNSYGPAIGRKLVVCIDDVHLTTVLEEGLPVAAQLVAFSHKFKAIFTPGSGMIPLTDLVFCGALDHQLLHPTVSRAGIEINLPPLDGDELAAGLWELFEGCCAKKRVELFPRQAAAFVAIAHSYFVRVVNNLQLPERAIYVSGYDMLLRQSLELLPQRFREALRATEIVRTNLLTSIPDVQVASNAFKYVDELYSAMLLGISPDGVLPFRENLVRVAEVTLGICARDVVFKDLVNHNEILFDKASAGLADIVASWINMMEDSVHLMKTDVLETVMLKGQTNSSMAPENANRSILISYPSFMSSGPKVAMSPQPQRKGSGRVRSGRGHSTSTGQGFVAMSRTYSTTWLVTHANFLAKALRHDEMHFVFTTAETFGCQRLLRLVCCAVCMPLALFRDKRVGYTYETFQRELKASISYALLNDTGMVLYIPVGIIQLQGAAWLVDTIMRTGDVSELFPSEELTALAKGYSLGQRSLRQLTPTEALDLRRRVQHLLHFILHVDSPEMLQQLARGYPSMNHLFAMALHTPASDSQLHLEIAQEILEEQDSWEVRNQSREEFENKFGSNDEVARLICVVYETVSEILPTKGEQLIEFTQLVRKFRYSMIKRIQYNIHMANVVSNHGYGADNAEDLSAKLKLTNQKLKEAKKAIKELNNRHKMEETARNLCIESAELAKSKLFAEQEELSEQETRIKEEEVKLRHNLTAAAHAVKKAKAQSIRNFSQSRVPEKGSLLVRAVFRLLEEELPRYNNNRTELWNQGVKLMCKNGFGEMLTSIRPEDITDTGALMSLYNELSEVRYTGSLAYGQVIADYILAVMAILNHRDETNDTKFKTKKEASQSNLHLLLSRAESAKSVADETAKSIQSLEKLCEDLMQSQASLEEREVLLSQFVTLVDRFAEFVVTTDSRQIECVEGDIILVAAIFSLLIMHRDMEPTYQKLQGVLLERGIRTTLRWESAVKQLLFPGQSRQIDSFVSGALSRRHRLVLYSLLARIHWRWPLIGGVCDIFEESLKEYLSFECSQCIILSAYDPVAKNEIIHALKDGSGLIIRDVLDVSTVDLIRPLNSILQRITEIRNRNMGEKKFTTLLYGKEVEVDVRFFLICTSPALIPCDKSSPMTQWFHVVNLFLPLSHSYRYERLLFRAPTVKNLQEDIINKRELLYDEVFSFIHSYETATHLISEDFAKEDAKKLKELEEVIEELTLHYGMITQYVTQLQLMTKQQRDAWIPVEGAIKRCAHVLRFIEFNKLERPWNDTVLDSHVKTMCNLSHHLLARLSPQIYAEISMPEKHFYAIVNFLENVLRGFNNGWPHYMRNIFALLLVGDVTSNSEEILRQRGYLYPPKLEMLNADQVSVLRSVLSDEVLRTNSSMDDEEEAVRLIRETIQEYYVQSEDPLLVAVAAERDSDDESLVEHFFISLLEFNVERAGKIAEQLTNGFFLAVRDSKWLTNGTDGGHSGRDDEAAMEAAQSPTAMKVYPPLHSVRTEEDLFIQGVTFCMPICIMAQINEEELILRRLPNYAQLRKWSYRWFHVTKSSELKTLPHVILQSFYSSPGDAKGNCLVLHIDLPSTLLRPSTELTEKQKCEITNFVEEFQRTLLAFHGRRYVGDNTSSRKVTVCLIVVVNQIVHDVLWGDHVNQGHLSLLRCLYFTRLFVTPQRHLLDLLNTHPSLHRADWERKSRTGSQLPGATRSIISSRSHDSGESRTSLESMALLVAKELMIVHVAMAQRTRVTQSHWMASHGVPFPELNGKQLVNDENLTLLLMILKGWMQWTDSVVDEAEQSMITIPPPEESSLLLANVPVSANLSRGDLFAKSPMSLLYRPRIHGSRVITIDGGHTGLNPQSMHDAKAEIQHQVGNIFSMQDNREHHAYLFYRKQLRMWSLISPQPAASSPTVHHVVDRHHSGVGGGGHVDVANPEDMPLGSGPNEDPVEIMENQLCLTIFNTFQKFAYEVLSCYGISHGEGKALKWLLGKIVVAPSNSQVVSCHYTDLMPRCPLLLDADTDFNDFETEVGELPSDLVELCGDGLATLTYRHSIRKKARELFFHFASTSSMKEPYFRHVPTSPGAGEATTPTRRFSHERSSTTSVPGRAQSSLPEKRPRIARVQSSNPQRVGSAGQNTASSTSPEPRPNSGSFPRQQQSEWKHDCDNLLRSHILTNMHSESGSCNLYASGPDLLSRADLATHNELVDSHANWLSLENEDDNTPSPEIIPWMLEKKHAVDLLQYFSSTKARVPEWERESLFNTFKCLATRAFIREKSPSVWLPALSNPPVALHLISATIHRKLSRLLDDDERETRSDWLEGGVYDTVIIVTQRRLLSAGDVVLSRARLSHSLQDNIQKVTQWPDSWFQYCCSTPMKGASRGEDDGNNEPNDVVVAVRMMEIKIMKPPMNTVVMLESPMPKKALRMWTKPKEVVLRYASDGGARGFTWSIPTGYSTVAPPQTSTTGGHNQTYGMTSTTATSRRESKIGGSRRQSVFSSVGGAQPFFTSIDLERATHLSPLSNQREIHLMSTAPVDIFYEARRMGKFHVDNMVDGDLFRLTGKEGKIGIGLGFQFTKSNGMDDSKTLLEQILPPSEDGENMVFAVERTWERMVPRALCVIAERNGENSTMEISGLEIPRDGLLEYYIFID